MESWPTHRWIPPLGRVLEIEGQSLRHFRCEACKRDFVEEMESSERNAVNVGSFGFERLSDEMTDRWLRTPCRGNRPVDDEEDRQKILTDFDFGRQNPYSSIKFPADAPVGSNHWVATTLSELAPGPARP
jgi:hypothetical protein